MLKKKLGIQYQWISRRNKIEDDFEGVLTDRRVDYFEKKKEEMH
jgi:hypothetical protein